jgi:Concanavalin A-like lectin/glucanases superfamily
MSDQPIGGPAFPLTPSADRPVGGVARRAVASDAPLIGGEAQPAYLVSDAELASGAFSLDGAPPIPLALVTDRPVAGGRPTPIYLVGAAPPPPSGPPAGLRWQVTARAETLTLGEFGDDVVGWADDYAQTTGFVAVEGSGPLYNAALGPGGTGALIFAGAQRLSMDDALDVPPISTIELWVWVNLTGGFAYQTGFAKDIPSAAETNLYPRGGAGSASSFLDSAGANTTLTSSVDPTPMNAWNYFVLRKDGVGWTMWLNGAQVAAVAYAPAPVPRDFGWQIGNSTLDEPLSGRVAQVAVWSIAASAAQIVARAAAGPRGADGEEF